MNISILQIGFGLEVPDKITLNIYLSGCLPNKQCVRDKCHNPELHDFNNGTDYKLWLHDITMKTTGLIQGFVLIGGEPLDQNPKDLLDLINFLNKLKLPIYLYTGYTEQQLNNHELKGILNKFTKIYYGEYIPNKNNKKELKCLI